MKTVIKESEMGVREDDLLCLEGKLGFALPEEYRRFSLRYNGGYPDPDSFVFFNKNLERQDASSVDRFLYVGKKIYESIENYIVVFDERIPKGYVPIARDPGGSLILIKSIGNEDIGGVFFWDHEFEVDEDESESLNENNIYFIAKSFNEFLESLYELEDE